MTSVSPGAETGSSTAAATMAKGRDINTNHNFALVLEAVCQRQPARAALFSRGGTVSYAGLAALIDAWAAALAASGAGPGRCVALWLPNSPAFVAAVFAALRLGATVAPKNVA